MSATQLLTPQQLATRWAFHTESVRRMIRSGRVQALRLGKRVRVPLSEVEKIEADGLRPRGIAR
jgi:excisionase family DNA binding protein